MLANFTNYPGGEKEEYRWEVSHCALHLRAMGLAVPWPPALLKPRDTHIQEPCIPGCGSGLLPKAHPVCTLYGFQILLALPVYTTWLDPVALLGPSLLWWAQESPLSSHLLLCPELHQTHGVGVGGQLGIHRNSQSQCQTISQPFRMNLGNQEQIWNVI